MSNDDDVKRQVQKMQKKYGTQGVMAGSDVPPVEVVSTGILSLDYALGLGGWPRGLAAGIFGPPEIGKSTILGFQAIREAQAMGKPAAIVAMEGRYDGSWASRHGIDNAKLVVSRPKHGREAFDQLQEFVESGIFGVIVFDSIGALLYESEMELKGGPKQGGQSGLITWGIKRLNPVLQHIDTSVLLLNQVRVNMKAMGNYTVYEQPGGQGLRHGQIITVQLRAHADPPFTMGNGDDVITVGRRIVAQITKNQLAEGTGNKAVFDFYQKETDAYPFGVDRIRDVFNTGKRTGVIEQGAGGYYTLPSGSRIRGEDTVVETLHQKPQEAAEIREAVLTVMRSKAVRPKLEAVSNGD